MANANCCTFSRHRRLAHGAAWLGALALGADDQALGLWLVRTFEHAIFIWRDGAPAEVAVFHHFPNPIPSGFDSGRVGLPHGVIRPFNPFVSVVISRETTGHNETPRC
jgi:hypothetical protein